MPLLLDLQIAAVSGDGGALDLGGQARDVVLYILWSSGVTAGTVTIETAPISSYTGTWSLIQAVTGASNKVDVVFLDKPYNVVRARISTSVAGGTVSVAGHSA